MPKWVKWYLAGGGVTLAWSFYRASQSTGANASSQALYVWPGLGTTPPGPMVAALENFALWPYAALKMLAPPAAAAQNGSDSSDSSTDGS